MKEELKVDKEKKIIDKIVNQLASEDPNLYYSDSSIISALVKERIDQKVGVSHTEYLELKDLTVKDILIRLSYHSNCC